MVFHRRRISIIGCGHVGMTCAHALLQSRLFNEIVLVDDDQERVRGEALDLRQATPFETPVAIHAGDYRDAAASEIVMLTVGAPGKFSGSRLDLLADNVGIVRSCVRKLMVENFDGALLIATNPVDVLTLVAQKDSGLPPGRVIGSGTLIDTLRLCSLLGEKLHVDPRSVHAQVIGEHGDSSVVVWSAAHVSGLPLAFYPGAEALPSREDLLAHVRRAGPEVVALKGNTCYAIAACVIRVCEAIARDERSVLVVSTLMTGQYGLHDVCLGSPCVIGENGVESVLELRLDPAEQKALVASAEVLRHAHAQLPAA